MKPNRRIVQLLWIGVGVLSLIGVAIVVRRALALTLYRPASGSATNGIDSGFAPHTVLTMFHIMPGLVFVLLGPLQFIRKLRTRRPAVHRWVGRVFVAAGLIVGTTALVMSPQLAIGGANEIAATMFFAGIFLFALVRAFLYIRRRQVSLHREWMIRAYAIGLAVATIRPIVGVFFATRPLTHLTPHEFFGIAFWLGFTTQLMVAEVWINYTRIPQAQIKARPQ